MEDWKAHRWEIGETERGQKLENKQRDMQITECKTKKNTKENTRDETKKTEERKQLDRIVEYGQTVLSSSLHL